MTLLPPPPPTAEESGAGKQILLERGAYEDMDVCIMYVLPLYTVAVLFPPFTSHRVEAPPPIDSLLTKRLAARCHPVAGDTLEIGFVSCLALQTLSVEYFGQSYVPTSIPPGGLALSRR